MVSRLVDRFFELHGPGSIFRVLLVRPSFVAKFEVMPKNQGLMGMVARVAQNMRFVQIREGIRFRCKRKRKCK
jgi:hypothetical protein